MNDVKLALGFQCDRANQHAVARVRVYPNKPVPRWLICGYPGQELLTTEFLSIVLGEPQIFEVEVLVCSYITTLAYLKRRRILLAVDLGYLLQACLIAFVYLLLLV